MAHCLSAKHLPLDAHWALLYAHLFFLFWIPRADAPTPRTAPLHIHLTMQHHFKVGSAPWSPETQVKSGSHWAQVSVKPAEPKRHSQSQVGGGGNPTSELSTAQCWLIHNPESHRLATETSQLLFMALMVRGGSRRGCWDVVLSCDLDPIHSHAEPTCQCRRQKRDGFDPWVGKIP